MNRFFDKGAFKEAFAQLKVPGLVFTVIGALISILYPVGMIVERYQYKEEMEILGVFPASYFYILFAVALVFAPCAILSVLGFLNKRNSCDFYHSVPVKREALYISSAAAAFLWIVILFLDICGFAMVITGFDPNMSLDMLEAGEIILEAFVTCILVGGVFGLGTALTGTGLTNFVVSMMILVGPRAIIIIIQFIFGELVPFANLGYGNTVLNHSYNMFFKLFTDATAGHSISYWTPVIYSTLLGIVYFILGCLVFVKRKSETAAQATAYPVVQTVCKMVPSFMCALIAIWGFLESTLNGEANAVTYFVVVVLIIISVAIYFIYDLITNKKARSFIKSVKQLPIFFGVIIVTTIIIGGAATSERNWEPNKDEITKVEIYEFEYLYSYFGIEKIEIEDARAIEIIVDAYNRQMKEHDNDADSIYIHGTGYEYEHNRLIVGIKEGWTTKYKSIGFTEKENEELLSISAKAVKKNGYSISLPRFNDYHTDIYCSRMPMRNGYGKRLYDCLRDEIKDMDIAEVMNDDNENAIDYVHIYINPSYGGTPRDITIPVGDNLPKTRKLITQLGYEYTQYYKKQDESLDGVSDFDVFEEWVEKNISKGEKTTSIYMDYVLTDCDLDREVYCYVEDTLNNAESRKIFELLHKIIEESKNEKEDYVTVYMELNVPDENDELWHIIVAYKVSEETAKEYMDFIGTLNYMTFDEDEVTYEIID